MMSSMKNSEMSEEEKKREQQRRVRREALLQVEIDDFSDEEMEDTNEIDELRSRLCFKIADTDLNKIQRDMEAIYESMRQKRQEQKAKEQELNDLQQEIDANIDQVKFTEDELRAEINEAIAWFTSLPHQNRISRDHLVAKLRKTHQSNRLLITGPVQSGKTTLGKLMAAQIMRDSANASSPDGNVFYISFADFKPPVDIKSIGAHIRKWTLAMNERFPHVFPIRGWNAFQSFIDHRGNTLILDECQVIYDYDHFWTSFKDRCCNVLAIGSGAELFRHLGDRNGGNLLVQFQPVNFTCIAFNEAEFDELFGQFKARDAAKFGDRVCQLVKFLVSLDSKEQIQNYLFYETRPYHPGLTVACLEEISEMAESDESGVLAALEKKSLYRRLRDKGLRCLVSLEEAEPLFQSLVRSNYATDLSLCYQYPEYLKEEKTDAVNKIAIESIALFPKTLVDLALELVGRDTANIDTRCKVGMACHDAMVRSNFCFDYCDKGTRVRLSCELIREHLIYELRAHFNCNDEASSLKSFTSLEDYIVAILKKLDPVRLRLYRERNWKDQIFYKTEFALQSLLHTTHELQGDYNVKNQSWGLSFMSSTRYERFGPYSQDPREKLAYFEKQGMNEFFLVDLMYEKDAPDLSEYNFVPDHLIPNILIVNFTADLSEISIRKLTIKDGERMFKDVVIGEQILTHATAKVA